MKCPRRECQHELDNEGVCQACGEGSKLSEHTDHESGRRFDEWWASVPKAEMMQNAEDGTIQEKFDLWSAQQSTKH